jgi:phenylalanyl-tRNA synthetase beta chain
VAPVPPARLDELQVPEGDIRRDVVRLANPLSAEQPLLRTSLMATLVDALRVNLSRGAQDVGIYEVGRVYMASRIGDITGTYEGDTIDPDDVARLDAALGDQPRRVGGIMTGARVPADWSGPAVPFEWSDAVAAVERVAAAVGVTLSVAPEQFAPWHPGRCAAFSVEGFGLVGVAGELHPRVLEDLGLPARTVAFELVLDPLVSASAGVIASATPVAGHPLAKEDFAFVVDASVAAGDLVAALRAGHEFVEDVRVFDVYQGAQVGEGKKSVAVNVVMRAPDRTLSADDVLAVRTALIAVARDSVGAALR